MEIQSRTQFKHLSRKKNIFSEEKMYTTKSIFLVSEMNYQKMMTVTKQFLDDQDGGDIMDDN